MNTKNIFKTFFLCLSVISLSFTLNAQELKPLRLGVAGVSHGHLHEVLIRLERGDFEIVGVAEPDEQLRVNNPLRKKVDSSLFYADLEEMLDKIIDYTQEEHINLSLPSLRVDNFSRELMERIQGVRKSSLTFAPEAGTQRLRDVINKNVSEEELMRTAGIAFSGGFAMVKLYFMMGLPTETLEDIEGIVHLAEKLIDLYYNTPERSKGKTIQISISCATFVPKPFTPFEFEPQVSREELLKRQEHLLSCIQPRHRKKIKVSWHTYEISLLEAVLARGDRRLAPVIERAWQLGSKFDSWSECFHYEIWEQAMQECGADPAFYSNRNRAYDEIFPWDHLDYLVDKAFFVRENQTAHASETTPHCRAKCSGCGVNRRVGRACF